MEPRGPTATSGGRSFSEGHVYRESCHVGICLYIYVYIYIPGKPYCHLVLVKMHFSSFFVDYRFFLNIRYFSNLRVRVFSTTCWKNMGLFRVSASRLIKYKTKYAYGHFWGHLRGLPRIDKKDIGTTVSQVCISYLFLEQDTKWVKEKAAINYMIYWHVEFVDILFRFSIICI